MTINFMSLFVCEECGVIENTALCLYWMSKKKLCSQCDPEIEEWHGIFPRDFFKDGNWEIDRDNFVKHKVDK